MADDNEDQWLYGDSEETKNESQDNLQVNNDNASQAFGMQDDSCSQNAEYPQNNEDGSGENAKQPEENTTTTADNDNLENSTTVQKDDEESSKFDADDSTQPETKENGTGEGQSQEEGEGASDSDSDDDVHVVIGDVKSTPGQYSSLNIKRGGLITAGPDKLKQPGKFSIDEFETIGSINGIPAHEYNLDQLEDKPWRQPGADITDYFNYGFNEETWRAYCERQKRMRSESGVGLVLNTNNPTGPPGVVNSLAARVPQVTITNYNSKYSGIIGPKRAGPPPGRKMAGTIDVIGNTGAASRRNVEKSPPKENVIQVMTAERREYSRKTTAPPFPDMSVPPPIPPVPPGIPVTFDMPPPGYAEPPPFYVEPDPYFNSYEPTQDRQWNNDPTWQPTNISIPLTGNDIKPNVKSVPTMIPPTMPPISSREMRDRDRERDREGHRERDRERDRDREREKDSMVRERERDVESSTREVEHDRERSRSVYKHKDRHRHRSRSRPRRHKSRSRSPSRRKKKSRRAERERSKEESE